MDGVVDTARWHYFIINATGASGADPNEKMRFAVDARSQSPDNRLVRDDFPVRPACRTMASGGALWGLNRWKNDHRKKNTLGRGR
jgi:hypothetical protein